MIPFFSSSDICLPRLGKTFGTSSSSCGGVTARRVLLLLEEDAILSFGEWRWMKMMEDGESWWNLRLRLMNLMLIEGFWCVGLERKGREGRLCCYIGEEDYFFAFYSRLRAPEICHPSARLNPSERSVYHLNRFVPLIRALGLFPLAHPERSEYHQRRSGLLNRALAFFHPSARFTIWTDSQFWPDYLRHNLNKTKQNYVTLVKNKRKQKHTS